MHTHTYSHRSHIQMWVTRGGWDRSEGFGTSWESTGKSPCSTPLIPPRREQPHSCSVVSQAFQGRKDPAAQVAGLDSILHTPYLSLSFSSVEWGSLPWSNSTIDDMLKVLPLIQVDASCCMGKLRYREATRLGGLSLLSFFF